MVVLVVLYGGSGCDDGRAGDGSCGHVSDDDCGCSSYSDGAQRWS